MLLPILLLLLSTLPGQPAYASVTANYEHADPVEFTKGTTPFNQNQLVAHIGTLRIESTDGTPFYSPALRDMTISNHLYFIGPTTRYEYPPGNPVYSDESTSAHLVAVTRWNGNTETINIWGGSGYQPLTRNSSRRYTGLFQVDLYLVNYQKSSIFKKGEYYEITSGTLGTFNVAVSDNKNKAWEAASRYIPLTFNKVPVHPVSTGPEGLSSIPYGTGESGPSAPEYRLTISAEDTFSIPQAIGSGSAKVGEAILTMTGGDEDQNNAVEITFSDEVDSQSFALSHEDDQSIPKIGYSLSFLSKTVVGGEPILWDDLKNGDNTEDIVVTGINRLEAETAVSGRYNDTISVTIKPIDTL